MDNNTRNHIKKIYKNKRDDIKREIVLIENSQDLLEEIETEIETFSTFVTDLYRKKIITLDKIINDINIHKIKNNHEKIIGKCEFFKTMLEILSNSIHQIRNKLCDYVYVFRDKDNNRLLSMCVFRKIKDSQFHMNITKSIKTSLLYLSKNQSFPKDLSIQIHIEASRFTDARYIYAPPLEPMLTILKNNFEWERLPKIGLLTDYSLYFNQDECTYIQRFWPNDFVGIYVYRFFFFQKK